MSAPLNSTGLKKSPVPSGAMANVRAEPKRNMIDTSRLRKARDAFES